MVEISKSINDKIMRICEKGFPYEVCGVLIGTKNNNKYIVKDFYDCENLNKADKKKSKKKVRKEIK